MYVIFVSLAGLMPTKPWWDKDIAKKYLPMGIKCVLQRPILAPP